jgi:hypothetical protein
MKRCFVVCRIQEDLYDEWFNGTSVDAVCASREKAKALIIKLAGDWKNMFPDGGRWVGEEYWLEGSDMRWRFYITQRDFVDE